MTRHLGAIPVMTVRHDGRQFGFPHRRSRRRKLDNKIPIFFSDYHITILYYIQEALLPTKRALGRPRLCGFTNTFDADC